MRWLLLLSSILFIILSCSSRKKEEVVRQSSLPPCVQNLIREFLTKSASGFYENCPGDIYSYTYKGKIVYFVPAQSRVLCDDVPGSLYDDNCNLIVLYGGLDDKGDGREKDFFKEKAEERLVWKFKPEKYQ